MVGPGTGIAPFRSFWQEVYYQRTFKNEKVINNMDIYFGCRNSNIDHLYADEIDIMMKAGVITNYHLALSRELNVPKVSQR